MSEINVMELVLEATNTMSQQVASLQSQLDEVKKQSGIDRVYISGCNDAITKLEKQLDEAREENKRLEKLLKAKTQCYETLSLNRDICYECFDILDDESKLVRENIVREENKNLKTNIHLAIRFIENDKPIEADNVLLSALNGGK